MLLKSPNFFKQKCSYLSLENWVWSLSLGKNKMKIKIHPSLIKMTVIITYHFVDTFKIKLRMFTFIVLKSLGA